jgi:hypothetical protein
MARERPRWMSWSPQVSAVALVLTLTRHVGLLSTRAAAAVALATLAYLVAVIVAEHRRHGLGLHPGRGDV